MQINVTNEQLAKYESEMTIVVKKVSAIAQSLTESNISKVQKQKSIEPFEKILKNLNLEEQKFVFAFLIELQKVLHPKSNDFLKFKNEIEQEADTVLKETSGISGGNVKEISKTIEPSDSNLLRIDGQVIVIGKSLPEIVAQKNVNKLKASIKKELPYSSFMYLTLLQSTIKKICESESVSSEEVKWMIDCMVKHFDVYSRKSVVPNFAENQRLALGGATQEAVKFFVDTFSATKRNRLIEELPWGPMIKQSAQDQCYVSSLKILAEKFDSYENVKELADYSGLPFVYFSKNCKHKEATNTDFLLKEAIDFLEKDVNIRLSDDSVVGRASLYSKVSNETTFLTETTPQELLNFFESGKLFSGLEREVQAKVLFMKPSKEVADLKIWERTKAIEEGQLMMLKAGHPKFRKIFAPLLHALQESNFEPKKLSDEYSEKLKRQLPFFAMYGLPSMHFFKLYECLNEKNQNEIKQIPLSYLLNDKIAHWICTQAIGTEKEEERKKEIITCCALAARLNLPNKDKWLLAMASVLEKECSWKRFADVFFDKKTVASTEALLIHRNTNQVPKSHTVGEGGESRRNRIRL